jgi:hypothetical protein
MAEDEPDAGWYSLLTDPPERGTEGGVILLDEEHDLGARITLELLEGRANAITCGIYQWMMHTRFFASEPEARLAYDAMKIDLDAILQRIPLKSDADLESKMSASASAMSNSSRNTPSARARNLRPSQAPSSRPAERACDRARR